MLLLCRSLKVLPETLKKIVTFLKTLQAQFFSKLKFAKKTLGLNRSLELVNITALDLFAI